VKIDVCVRKISIFINLSSNSFITVSSLRFQGIEQVTYYMRELYWIYMLEALHHRALKG